MGEGSLMTTELELSVLIDEEKIFAIRPDRFFGKIQSNREILFRRQDWSGLLPAHLLREVHLS